MLSELRQLGLNLGDVDLDTLNGTHADCIELTKDPKTRFLAAAEELKALYARHEADFDIVFAADGSDDAAKRAANDRIRKEEGALRDKRAQVNKAKEALKKALANAQACIKQKAAEAKAQAEADAKAQTDAQIASNAEEFTAKATALWNDIAQQIQDVAVKQHYTTEFTNKVSAMNTAAPYLTSTALPTTRHQAATPGPNQAGYANVLAQASQLPKAIADVDALHAEVRKVLQKEPAGPAPAPVKQTPAPSPVPAQASDAAELLRQATVKQQADKRDVNAAAQEAQQLIELFIAGLKSGKDVETVMKPLETAMQGWKDNDVNMTNFLEQFGYQLDGIESDEAEAIDDHFIDLRK